MVTQLGWISLTRVNKKQDKLNNENGQNYSLLNSKVKLVVTLQELGSNWKEIKWGFLRVDLLFLYPGTGKTGL